MSNFFGGAHGVTTSLTAVGLSGAINVTLAPHVAGTYIRHVSGGTLYFGYAGVSTTVGASIFAELITKGAVALAAGEPLLIPGPAPLSFAAAGATAIVSIVRLLSDGYAGQY